MDVRKFIFILTSFVVVVYVTNLRLFQISKSPWKLMIPDQQDDAANKITDSDHRIADDRFNESKNHQRLQPKRLVHEVDCQQIIDGDEEYLLIANETMSKWNYTFPTDKEIGDLAQNCEKFLDMYNYEYFFVSPEELDFPIAYTILTYKDAVQTEKLLRAIYRPHNLYCIHVDQSSNNALLYAMKSIANCLPNVFIASKLEDVIYAGFSRLQADLNCLSDLLNNTDVKWRYVINLPSQEFPLKTNLEIVKILKIFKGTSSVDSYYYEYTEYRCNETYTVKNGKVASTGKKKGPPPYNITIGKGSAYGVFSRDFVNYSINDVKARDILKWLEDTYSPDESFWATLVLNKNLNVPGANYAENRTSEFWIAVNVLWYLKKRDCDGKYVHDICVFGLGDLNRLVSEKELFANKFIHNYRPLALQCMEEWIYNKTFSNIPFQTYYYRQLIKTMLYVHLSMCFLTSAILLNFIELNLTNG